MKSIFNYNFHINMSYFNSKNLTMEYRLLIKYRRIMFNYALTGFYYE